MVANRNEKRNARLIAEYLDITYVHALRLLRSQEYVVRGDKVEEGPNRGKK